MVRHLFILLMVTVLAGCSTNSTFIYKPVSSVDGGTTLPVKVAVLTFKDGTEDFTSRGSIFDPESLYYNLAKAGIGGQITALTPDLWAKAFADDIAASGVFKSSRFVYSPSELADEEFYIEGTLKKATISGSWAMPSEFALALRAMQRSDNQLVWEKEVSYSWKNTPALYEGCGAMSVQCMIDRHHADVNRVMRILFTDARTDLVRTLLPLSGGRMEPGKLSPSATSTPQSHETADDEIDIILRGK